MNNKDLPAMPTRLRKDWSKSKIGQCDCGYHGSIIDGMCADCHDVEYQQEREQVLIDRIIELQSQYNSLTKREIFAKDAPDMPEWWFNEQEHGGSEYQEFRLRCMIAWRWHYADMMLEGEK